MDMLVQNLCHRMPYVNGMKIIKAKIISSMEKPGKTIVKKCLDSAIQCSVDQ